MVTKRIQVEVLNGHWAPTRVEFGVKCQLYKWRIPKIPVFITAPLTVIVLKVCVGLGFCLKR